MNTTELTTTKSNLWFTNNEENSNNTLLLKPISTIDDIVKAYEEYNLLKSKLLKYTDYHEIKWKKYIKKSWFRKLATAFWISTQIVKESRINNNEYFIYEITARAISNNWRFSEACASCASNERSFNHLENDVRATAQTRATNRAIADLIWSWEVSAEEVGNEVIVIDDKEENSDKHVRNSRTSLVKNNDWFEIDERIFTNLEEEDIEQPKAYVHKENTSYWNDDLITTKQRLLLIKLIENKYNDEKTKSSLIIQLEFLTKKEASIEIKKMISV